MSAEVLAKLAELKGEIRYFTIKPASQAGPMRIEFTYKPPTPVVKEIK